MTELNSEVHKYIRGSAEVKWLPTPLVTMWIPTGPNSQLNNSTMCESI